MKITKNMYDKELRSFYIPGKVITFLASRKWGASILHNLMMKPLIKRQLKGVKNEEIYISSTTTSNYKIRTRIFRRENSTKRVPVMLYLHGGGYQVGVPEQAFNFYDQILKRRDIVIVAPSYRLSRKDPYPCGFNDCYDTLLWIKKNAQKLNIDSNKIVVAGHSAGGGMTAAITLKARDNNIPIAFQMPMYPMLDCRQKTKSSQFKGAIVWDSKCNKHAWSEYLKELKNEKIPVYASPTLNTNYTNFPPTISFTGDLDIFRDELVNYIEALKKTKVPTLYKEIKGAFHGFELVFPKSKLGKEADNFQFDSFAKYYDKYCE